MHLHGGRFSRNELKITVLITFFQCSSVVCMSLCNIRPSVNFHLNKEGFHRELNFSVKIITDQDNIWTGSQVVFEQTIPSGSYVNPDELAELRRMNKVIACPVGFVNIESAEHESTPHVVHIYADLKRTGNILTAAVELPVHLRYHSATIGGSPATVILDSPILLLRSNSSSECGERRKAPCGPCHQNICDWFSVPYNSDTKHISVAVPVGNLNHTSFVIVITLFITIASAVCVWKVVVDYTRVALLKKRK